MNSLSFTILIEPGHEKRCLMSYANNKGADQPAHPRSLISAFVFRCLDNIISLDSMAKISRLELASVAAQTGLCLAWSETFKDTLCRVVAKSFTVFLFCCLTFKKLTRKKRRSKATTKIIDPSSKHFVQDEGHYWSNGQRPSFLGAHPIIA